MAGPQSVMARVFNSLCLFLQIAGLGTAIAGVAILQDSCNNYNDGYNFMGIFGLGPNTVTDMLAVASGGGRGWDHHSYDCGMQYSWYWWVLALELVCICAGILANFTSLRRGKQCIISFYATASALWCIFAYAMLWAVYLYQASDNGSFKDNKWAQGYACGGAGAIAVLVGNFLFLMIFGWDSSDVTVEVTKGDAHTGFQAA